MHLCGTVSAQSRWSALRRLPDYHLSDLGRERAQAVADDLRSRDIVHLAASLGAGSETMETIADVLGLPVSIDGRVIEAEKYLRG